MKQSFLSFGDRPLARGIATPASVGSIPQIVATNLAIDETALPNAVVGRMSVVNPGGQVWTLAIVDNAGNRFAQSGDNIVVGATPLSFDALPAPQITVRATSAAASFEGVLTLNVRRALPALPFAVGARVAAIGDSQIGYNSTFGGAVGTGSSNNSLKAAMSTGYGFVEWARAIDSRFRFDNWFDIADPRGLNYVGASQGIHGDHLDWTQAGYGGGILGRLPAVLARRPDILILEGGLNTLHSGDDNGGRTLPAAYCIAKMDRALTLCRNAGVRVVLMSIYPTGLWGAADPRHLELAAFATWCKAQAGRDGVLAVLDADDILAPGGVLDATMFQGDRVHLSALGSLRLGREKLLPILQAAIQAGSTFSKDPSVDNLFPEALRNLAGTTGAKSQNGIVNGAGSPTGNVATGLTLNIGRNCTIVASKNVLSGALEEQVIAVTPGGTASGNYGEFTLGGFGLDFAFDAGDWIMMAVECEIDNDQLTFLDMTGGLRVAPSTVVNNGYFMGRQASGDYDKPMPGGPKTWWIVSHPIKSHEGLPFNRAGFSLRGTFSKAATPFTLRVRRPIIRKIADPRAAWGYPV